MSMDEKGAHPDEILRESAVVVESEKAPSPVPEQYSSDWPLWWPLIGVVLLSLIIRAFEIDQKISEMCYDPELKFWPFDTAQPWLWFYRNGTLPPLVVGIAGGLIFVFGSTFLRHSNPAQTNRTRRAGLFLVLLLLIAPGLLVNSSLKMLWGRPRPWQCEQFGGELKFLPVGEWGTQSLPNSSFPSGHAAVAFFLMGLGFVVSPRRPWLQKCCFLGGVAYGLAMGFTRVLQGGHFTSDILWAGAIVYFVAVLLARLLVEHD